MHKFKLKLYMLSEVVDQFMDSCPNIEALHIGDYCGSGSVSSDGVDFLSAIRFSRLTSLSLSGFDLFDGSFVPLVRLKLKHQPSLLYIIRINYSFF